MACETSVMSSSAVIPFLSAKFYEDCTWRTRDATSRPSDQAPARPWRAYAPSVGGRVRVGTSGWVYEHWRGRFYPKDLPQAKWLEWYAERFDTVELNNSFYRQPSRAQFERWRRAVPAGFQYAVKLNRFVTHMKRLNV